MRSVTNEDTIKREEMENHYTVERKLIKGEFTLGSFSAWAGEFSVLGVGACAF